MHYDSTSERNEDLNAGAFTSKKSTKGLQSQFLIIKNISVATEMSLSGEHIHRPEDKTSFRVACLPSQLNGIQDCAAWRTTVKPKAAIETRGRNKPDLHRIAAD